MYKKLIKIFIISNIKKFFLILFCISLSLTGYLVSDNLVTNVKTLIGNEAKPQLGGDIKISSSIKLDNEQEKFLNELVNKGDIILSEKIQTYSTIFDKDNNSSLVSLLFIDNNYPLYGEYDVTKNNKSNLYVSKNVDDLYNLDDKISLFGKQYEIGGIINKIPGAGLNFFNDGKQIILEIDEFQKLGIEQIGARVDREFFIKLINQDNFDRILAEINDSNLFEGKRITDYKKGGNRFENLFQELDKFIKYILIISFLLTILIIFLSVESFYIGNKKSFSILKILGIKNGVLIGFNLLLFFFILSISLIISLVLTEIAFIYIRSFGITSGFYIDYYSLVKTSLLGLIIFGVSIIIPLLKFFSNNPLAGLKENFLQVYKKKEIIIELILLIVSSIIIYLILIGDFLGSLFFTLAIIIIVLFLTFFFKFILKFIYIKSNKLKNSYYSIYDAIRNTVKPGNLSILISFGFFISFTSLLFITIISLNFLSKLNIDLKNNNNIFVINLTKDNLSNLTDSEKSNTYSVILGRILNINGKDIKNHIGEGRGDSGRFTREFNITDNPLKDIKILKGNKIKSGEVSIDDDFSKSLRLNIGDKIEFSIYGKKKLLKVSNIRESNTNSVEPFFYFQVYEDDFINYPKTYFLTTYIEPSKIESYKNNFLEKTGNNISFIEVEEILKEIKSISKKVFLLIQFLFSYIFIFCVITLIVSVSFLIPFKKRKTKLYNILGANNSFLNKNNIFEYLYLQTLSLFISVLLASLSTYYILNKTDFIDFTLYNYLISLFILFLVFFILSIIIRIVLSRILK